MSQAATQQDLADLRTELKQEIRQNTEDILAEMRHFANMVSQRFDYVDARFEAVDQHFKEIEKELAAQRKDIRRIFTYLDAMAKKQEISDDERLVMAHQLDRAFKWLQQLADKLGVELKP